MPNKESYHIVYSEAARLAKPGGLVISAAEAQMDGWQCIKPDFSFDPNFGEVTLMSEEDTKRLAPGFYAMGKSISE